MLGEERLHEQNGAERDKMSSPKKTPTLSWPRRMRETLSRTAEAALRSGSRQHLRPSSHEWANGLGGPPRLVKSESRSALPECQIGDEEPPVVARARPPRLGRAPKPMTLEEPETGSVSRKRAGIASHERPSEDRQDLHRRLAGREGP